MISSRCTRLSAWLPMALLLAAGCERDNPAYRVRHAPGDGSAEPGPGNDDDAGGTGGGGGSDARVAPDGGSGCVGGLGGNGGGSPSGSGGASGGGVDFIFHNDAGNLYRTDTGALGPSGSPAITFVGAITAIVNSDTVSDLAMRASDGQLFMTTTTGPFGDLYRLDKSTATATRIGQVGRKGTGLAFDSVKNGETLHGCDGRSRYTISPTTGAVTFLHPADWSSGLCPIGLQMPSTLTCTDLAIAPDAGTLFGLAEDSASTPPDVSHLVILSKTTGCAVGLPVPIKVAGTGELVTSLDGLAWFCDKLFAVDRITGSLFKIDPNTATATRVLMGSCGPAALGSAYAPVEASACPSL